MEKHRSFNPILPRKIRGVKSAMCDVMYATSTCMKLSLMPRAREVWQEISLTGENHLMKLRQQSKSNT